VPRPGPLVSRLVQQVAAWRFRLGVPGVVEGPDPVAAESANLKANRLMRVMEIARRRG
jgi:hypothetical protein